MSKEKISVIVPVYNVEKYLKKCIDSIIAQTYTNLEIILLDDGSKDDSGKICDEYKEKDNRIIVIHKKNTGVSSTRNEGLKNITGSYVTFIDSDDYIEPDMIEILFNAIKKYNSDISICGTNDFNENYDLVKQSKCNRMIEMDKKSALKELLDEEAFKCVCWGKLYDVKLFNNIKFNEKTKIAEDLEVIYRLFDICDSIVYVPENKYNYIYRKNSVTKEIFNENWIREIEISKEILDFIKKKYSDIYEYAAKRYVRINVTCILKILNSTYNKNDIIQLRNNIKPYWKYYIKNKYGRKKFKIIILILLFNVDLLIYLYKIINKFKER